MSMFHENQSMSSQVMMMPVLQRERSIGRKAVSILSSEDSSSDTDGTCSSGDESTTPVVSRTRRPTAVPTSVPTSLILPLAHSFPRVAEREAELFRDMIEGRYYDEFQSPFNVLQRRARRICKLMDTPTGQTAHGRLMILQALLGTCADRPTACLLPQIPPAGVELTEDELDQFDDSIPVATPEELEALSRQLVPPSRTEARVLRMARRETHPYRFPLTDGDAPFIEMPFHIDFGVNTHIGRGVYFNFNCVILDSAPVYIGDHCLFGPGCKIITVGHSTDGTERSSGDAYGQPIVIGHNCWFGADVVVVPGARIGNNVVVAAGSVVRGVIPDNAIIAGVPATIKKESRSESEIVKMQFTNPVPPALDWDRYQTPAPVLRTAVKPAKEDSVLLSVSSNEKDTSDESD